jgi:RND family efflux transporter MFP subunit
LKEEVLTKYTKDLRTKKLQMAIRTAQSAEQAARESCETRQAEEAALRRQVAACTILAPADGLLVYANGPPKPDSTTIPTIREGATVRNRQKIFSVVDLQGPMNLIAKVEEVWIDRVRLGQTVRIKTDAFPDQTFSGVVRSIAPLPDPQSFLQNGAKLYSIRIAITEANPKLRPGMTSSAEILAASRDNVLSVPVQSVVRFDDTSHVAVKTPDGGIDWREVTLGMSNDTMVEVKEGLKSGETIVQSPIPLLSEDQKRKMPRRPTRRPEPKAKDDLPPISD